MPRGRFENSKRSRSGQKLTGESATVATAFADSLGAAESEIDQVRNHLLNYPIKLNDRIAGLASFAARGERRPPPQ